VRIIAKLIVIGPASGGRVNKHKKCSKLLAMARIVIDARVINTSTGWYINRLITYLQKIDNDNEYLILLKSEDYETWQPENDNFIKVISPYKAFTFAEQFGLKKQLKELNRSCTLYNGPATDFL